MRSFPSEGVLQFSAYPVLIPLYVAQYTPEDRERSNQSMTLFIQAHGTGVSPFYIYVISVAEPRQGCIMTARNTAVMEHVEDILRQIKLTETLEIKQNDGKFTTLFLNSMAFSSWPSKFWNLAKLIRVCTWKL